MKRSITIFNSVSKSVSDPWKLTAVAKLQRLTLLAVPFLPRMQLPCSRLATLGLVLATLCALTTQSHAQGGIPLWTNAFNIATSIAVDNGGNAFVTGAGSTLRFSTAGVPLWIDN